MPVKGSVNKRYDTVIHHLVITLPDLRDLLRAIQEPGSRGRVQRAALHLSRFQGGTEFLARSGTSVRSEGILLVWPVEEPEMSFPAEWKQSLSGERARPFVGLGIGVGTQQGKVAGVVHLDSEQASAALDGVRIVGPQMPMLHLTDEKQSSFRSLWVTADGLYSRLIGTM